MRFALILAIVATFLGSGGGICVLDNKHGWNVNCGIRDSYLFRVKDFGGLKANFDFGFGLGDEKGFTESITNTQGGSHYKRIDDESAGSLEEVPLHPRQATVRRAPESGEAPSLTPQRRTASGEAAARPPITRQAFGEQLYPEHRSRTSARRVPPPVPPFGLRPPPVLRRQISNVINGGGQQRPRPLRRRRPQASPNGNFHSQQILIRPGTSPTIVFTSTPQTAPPPSPTQTPANRPTVGPAIGDLLKVDASTPADTDHVPSFAAKMFVVREAPDEFNPPGYKTPKVFPKFEKRVEVPRTKFFCEEQKYLPGIYADVQLGCKVFHLCMPAAMGNTLTSFLCPNMTLFDQSIMQCNYWYHVNCENSPAHYDANLPMALSYRRMNAALLPLTAVRNFDNVALLSHNSEEMKNHQAIPPADPSIAENLALKRIGKVETAAEAKQRLDDPDHEIPRGPRKLSFEEKDTAEEESSEGGEIDSYPVKRSISFDGRESEMKNFDESPLLLKLGRS